MMDPKSDVLQIAVPITIPRYIHESCGLDNILGNLFEVSDVLYIGTQ